MKTHHIFTLLLLASTQLCAIIIESDSIEIIKQHVNGPQTLVVLDIDNTIAMNEKLIGRDQCFTYKFMHNINKGLSPREAVHKLLPTYCTIQNVFGMVLTEQCVPEVVRWLQQNRHVIGLTARSFPLIDRTAEQLRGVNIDFTKNSLPSDELDLSIDVPGKYKHGIAFCGQNNKGAILLYLFNQLGYHPKKIVFADDKMKNITAVENAVEAAGIEFVGIRYNRCDDEVANMDIESVEKEWKNFQKEHATSIEECVIA